MRTTAVISVFILFAISSNSQVDIKRIDSLVNEIRTSKDLIRNGGCDTSAASHSDIFVGICYYYFSTNGQLRMTVSSGARLKCELGNWMIDDTSCWKNTGSDTSYFHNDSLIKYVDVDIGDSSYNIEKIYFGKNGQALLDSMGYQYTDRHRKFNNHLHW